MGKTQLAIEYAYRHETEYSIIWWVRAEDPTQLAADYAELAKPLNLPLKDDADQPLVVTAVREWLRRNHGWLLLFDNAETQEDVRGFIPESKTGHVILTSRNPNWLGIGAKPFSVDVLPPEEAIALLLRRSGQMDQVAAGKLSLELGYLPLALEQAGAYMEATATPISEYLDLFREHGTRVFSDAPKNKDYPDTVATTWNISFVKVEETSAAAADMLRLFAFLAPENIPLELLQKGLKHLPKSLAEVCESKLEFKHTVGALRRYSLIDVQTDGFSVHRLVQAVIRDRLSLEDRKKWASVAVSLVAEAFPPDPSEPNTWPACAVLLPHCLVTADHAAFLDVAAESTAKLLTGTGNYLGLRGEFGPALAELQQALAISQKVWGHDHPNVAAALGNLGIVLMELGRFEEARESHEEALAIRRAVFGPEHPDVATCLSNLGGVLTCLGLLQEAKEMLELALAIRRKVWGPEHPDVATSLNNLGSLLADLGLFEEARRKHEEALEIYQKVLGPEPPDVATSLNNLGNVLARLGRLLEAKKKLGEALAIKQKVLGPEHPHVAGCLSNLGNVLEGQGLFEEARKKHEEALVIRLKVLGSEHPDVAGSLNNLGNALEGMGLFEQAREKYEEALAIKQKVLGPKHPDVAMTLNNLGHVLARLGLFEKAEENLKLALEICQTSLGEDHPTTRAVRNNLESLKANMP